MTKTIKICDKCGKECTWLYKIPYLRIKGFVIDVLEGTPSTTNEYCEECARKIVDKIDDIVLHQNF